MSADSYLAIVGGLFVVLTLLAYIVENGSQIFRTGKKLNVDGTIRLLGIVGMIIWFCIAFGAVSWVISVVYWFVIESVGKAF